MTALPDVVTVTMGTADDVTTDLNDVVIDGLLVVVMVGDAVVEVAVTDVPGGAVVLVLSKVVEDETSSDVVVAEDIIKEVVVIPLLVGVGVVDVIRGPELVVVVVVITCTSISNLFLKKNI
jgi:hypothetical protein